MAHRIYMQNGKASIMYYGERPWHGLGQEVGAPATAEMALQAALLDDDVIKQPIYACTGSLTHTLGNRFALIRKIVAVFEVKAGDDGKLTVSHCGIAAG
ncbi:MAG: hypothetical protein WBW69_08840 [Candidatus Korobacteraceae bacterium]